MNKIIIIGNLTKGVESRTTQGGVQVCSFTVAVQRKFADQSGKKPVDFIPVVAWKQLAELCSKYLAKGKQVAVEGSLQVRHYEDKDGNKRTAFEIQADEIQFLSPSEKKKDDGFTDVSGSALPWEG